MWHLRDKIFWSCYFLATVLLSTGFGITGLWPGLLAALGVSLFGLFIQNKFNPWLSTVYLILYVCLAAAGLFTGCEPFLMVNGTIAALGVWDVAQFQRQIKEDENYDWVKLLERQHYQSLGLALGVGFFLSNTGLVVRVQLPIGITMFLILIALFGLTRLYNLVNS